MSKLCWGENNNTLDCWLHLDVANHPFNTLLIVDGSQSPKANRLLNPSKPSSRVLHSTSGGLPVNTFIWSSWLKDVKGRYVRYVAWNSWQKYRFSVLFWARDAFLMITTRMWCRYGVNVFQLYKRFVTNDDDKDVDQMAILSPRKAVLLVPLIFWSLKQGTGKKQTNQNTEFNISSTINDKACMRFISLRSSADNCAA